MPSQLHDLIANGSFCRPARFSHVEGSFPLDEALVEGNLPQYDTNGCLECEIVLIITNSAAKVVYSVICDALCQV